MHHVWIAGMLPVPPCADMCCASSSPFTLPLTILRPSSSRNTTCHAVLFADTCASVAQFLSITEESLQQLNPSVSCSSRLPAFHSLCVERTPAKARPTCANKIRIGRVVDFKQVAASNGATMVDLCRLNPWISFRDSPRDIHILCVSAQYATPPPGDTTSPASNTIAPATNTTASASNTTAPASNTTATASNTTAPASNTTAPASNTTAPASNTTAPASSTTAPAGNTTTPASNTTAPVSNTTAPASNTTAPASNTTAPSEYPDAESSITGVCGYDIVSGCLGGTCIHRGTRDSTCVCLPNHPLKEYSCGYSQCYTCDQNWAAISSIQVAASNWRCKDVYTVYGLTLQQFTDMNHGINCSALLPQGRDLVVKELLPACSAFYYVQPNDTCSSVAQFLSITEESLQQLNPGVSCSSRLLAFRSLCEERNPAKARPKCESQIQIDRVMDFKQVAASNGATMVDLCRLNPWICFRDSLRDINIVCFSHIHSFSDVRGVLQ
ncbi:unnamed protein product [Closterium sp. NIES-64]|nr:unnamed protein product [Closterium sp. NIES-64]